MKHTLVAWMKDKPGVLSRVSNMVRRRNFNIDSLQVGHSEEPGISRMTFIVDGDERMVDQVIKQLRKLVDVTRIENLTDKPMIAREMALIRVQTSSENRSDIIQVVNMLKGDIVDVASDSMVAQIVGSEDRVDTLITLLGDFGILEMVRTGRVALLRGSKAHKYKRSSSVWRASANGAADPMVGGRLTTGGV